MTSSEIIEKVQMLKTLFPRLWAKPGSQFSPDHRKAIWVSAESSDFSVAFEGIGIIEVPMFDHYNDQYDMGVHPTVLEALNALNLWAEWYDSGTVMLYSKDVL